MAMDDYPLNFQGRAEPVFAVTIALMAVCTIVVFFRMLSRFAIVKKVSLEDYFIVAAWAIAFGLSFAICWGTAYGLGRHETDIPFEWQPQLRRANYAFSILYQPALMATKTSILIFYLTFSVANDIFRWGCLTTLFVVNAGGFALTMVTVFQCTPVGAVFQAVTPDNATCTNILTIYLSSVPLNLITDLAIFFLPMPILTSMRLPKKQKIILVITFGFGIFVAVVDVVRISYLQSASEMRLAELQDMTVGSGELTSAIATDSSFYLAFSFMWSAIEVTIGIMVACVPGLKPLVARVAPRMLRDEHDVDSTFGSFAMVIPEKEQTVPSIPDVAHDRSLGKAPVEEDAEHGEMDIMEFLSGRRDFAQSTSKPYEEVDTPEMGLDFLTTPEMAHGLERSQTALTNTTRNTAPQSPTFFDFVNMKQRKSLVHLTHRESLFPIAVVTVLFFVWGFEYGLLDQLNAQFQNVANVSAGQAVGLRSAYYAGYFVGPLTLGRLVLYNWGFKACFPIGLCIYASGCLIYWPAAVLTSWPTFLVTNFIVGFGLSMLEVSANAFIVLCGPASHAEIRLNISQGIQAVGSIVAPLIADKAFLHRSQTNAPSLVNTQWAYLGLSLTTVILAVIYFYLPLPEATSAELEDAAETLHNTNKSTVHLPFLPQKFLPQKYNPVPITAAVLAAGVVLQFLYVGAQEVNGSQFAEYLNAIAPNRSPTDFAAIAHSAFALSRFLAAAMGLVVKPRLLLVIFLSGVIVCTALCTRLTGGAGTAMMVLVFFFEGPLFSLIFAQSLRGQGRNTKFASVVLTAAISGGAVFSPVATVIAEAGQGNERVPLSLVVAAAAFAAAWLVVVVGNFNGRVRKLVDPVFEEEGGRALRDGSLRGVGSESSGGSGGRRLMGLKGLKMKFRGSAEVEYRERKGSPCWTGAERD
ncbi:unnamed protein product [Zymoseptoria tritici ST99CH_1E4]|uniref:Rhodopsin domain-containing protein n=1 Tax=Zymoseptoria tritici ST99CH_1E4 TaxID=1276532 RepID=A0A2H1H4K5_ZYMTR|nr:unnamed protein product [Zymoseptoria tritici ST99CH_1E4]